MNYPIAQTRLHNVGKIPNTFTFDSMAVFETRPRFLCMCVYPNEEAETDKSDTSNVVAYCSLDRYKSTTRRDGALYDPDSETLQAVSDLVFQSCKSGVAIAGKRKPFALTNNYDNLQKVAPKRIWKIFKRWLILHRTAFNDRLLSLVPR